MNENPVTMPAYIHLKFIALISHMLTLHTIRVTEFSSKNPAQCTVSISFSRTKPVNQANQCKHLLLYFSFLFTILAVVEKKGFELKRKKRKQAASNTSR